MFEMIVGQYGSNGVQSFVPGHNFLQLYIDDKGFDSLVLNIAQVYLPYKTWYLAQTIS